MSDNAGKRCYLVSKDLFITLSEGQAVVLGRDATASNFVLKDERVSRCHAMVFHRDNEYFLKDLNSSNGTFLNGTRVTGTPLLRSGDKVEIPPFKFEFVHPDYAREGADGPASPASSDKLEGTLSALPLTDLVQLLNVTKQSGILSIVDGIGRNSDLVFADGEITHVSYAGLGGEEAFFSLLRSNRQGRFEFTKKEPSAGAALPVASHTSRLDDYVVPGGRQVFRKTQSLLLEGVRILDEQTDTRPPPEPLRAASGDHPPKRVIRFPGRPG